ncbi:MAG TPA: PPE family protein, partial [Mycobacterium sp.]
PPVPGIQVGLPQATGPSAPAPTTADAGSPAPTPNVVYAVPALPWPGVGPGPESGSESPDTTTTDSFSAAAAVRAVAVARDRVRRVSRRRRGARGYRDELPDMKADMTGTGDNSPGSPVTAAGAHGAGPIGLTGAVTPTSAAPTGMVERMSAGGSPSTPLLPATWSSDAEDRREQR